MQKAACKEASRLSSSLTSSSQLSEDGDTAEQGAGGIRGHRLEQGGHRRKLAQGGMVAEERAAERGACLVSRSEAKTRNAQP